MTYKTKKLKIEMLDAVKAALEGAKSILLEDIRERGADVLEDIFDINFSISDGKIKIKQRYEDSSKKKIMDTIRKILKEAHFDLLKSIVDGCSDYKQFKYNIKRWFGASFEETHIKVKVNTSQDIIYVDVK